MLYGSDDDDYATNFGISGEGDSDYFTRSINDNPCGIKVVFFFDFDLLTDSDSELRVKLIP